MTRPPLCQRGIVIPLRHPKVEPEQGLCVGFKGGGVYVDQSTGVGLCPSDRLIHREIPSLKVAGIGQSRTGDRDQDGDSASELRQLLPRPGVLAVYVGGEIGGGIG